MADATQKLTAKVEDAVATAIVKPSTPASIEALPAIMTELLPIIDAIVHSAGAAPWYRSRTVWSGIIALMATLLGLVGITFPAEMQGTALTVVMAAIPAVGGALALYSHWKASKAAKTVTS